MAALIKFIADQVPAIPIDRSTLDKLMMLVLEDICAAMKPDGGRLARDQPATLAQPVRRIDYFLEYNTMQLFA
jgi:hypothetical protein